LYSHISFGIIDSTSDVELAVLLPSQTLLYVIEFELEELDGARGLSDQSRIEDQMHLAEYQASQGRNLIKLKVHGVVFLDDERLTLSIEGVDLLLLVVVVALIREVLLLAVHLLRSNSTLNTSLGHAPEKVVVGRRLGIE
jgi:hypothetical protein